MSGGGTSGASAARHSAPSPSAAAGTNFDPRGLWRPPDAGYAPGRSSFGGPGEAVTPTFGAFSPGASMGFAGPSPAVQFPDLQTYAEQQAMWQEMQVMRTEYAAMQAALGHAEAGRRQAEVERERLEAAHKYALLAAEHAAVLAERDSLRQSRLRGDGVSGGVLHVVATPDVGSTVAASISSGITEDFIKKYSLSNQPTLRSLDVTLQAILRFASDAPGVSEFLHYLSVMFGLPSHEAAPTPEPGSSIALAMDEVRRLAPPAVDAADVGVAEDVDDAASVAGSHVSSLFGSGRRGRTIFGGGNELAAYRRLVRFLDVEGASGRDVTRFWFQLDRACLRALRQLFVEGTLAYRYQYQFRTFVELFHALLLQINHSSSSAYADVCRTLVGPLESPLVASDTMYSLVIQVFQEDVLRRLAALLKLARSPMRFAVFCAESYLPGLSDDKKRWLETFLCKLRLAGEGLDEDSFARLVDEELAKTVNFDPRGTLEPNTNVAMAPWVQPAAAPAAVGVPASVPGGSKKQGQRSSPRASAAAAQGSSSSGGDGESAQPPPGRQLCAAGPQCLALGSRFGCSGWHTEAELAQRKRRLGAAYVSPSQAGKNRAALTEKAIRDAEAGSSPAVPMQQLSAGSPSGATSPRASQPAAPAVSAADEHFAKIYALTHGPPAAPQGVAMPVVGRALVAVSVSSPALPGDVLSSFPPHVVVAVRDMLDAYVAWHAGAVAELVAWTRLSQSEQAAYQSAHAGLDVVAVRNAEGLNWEDRLGQLRALLLQGGVSPAVAASVTAPAEPIVIFDSGSMHSFKDGTGSELRSCTSAVSVTAGGQRMVTDEMTRYHFNVKVQRSDGSFMYVRVVEDYRHVPGLHTQTAPFAIMAPWPILANGGEWINRGLRDCYLRLPYCPEGESEWRLTGKIALCWPPHLQICTIPTVSDGEVDETRLVYVSLAEMRARAGGKSSMACASLPDIVPAPRVPTSAAAAVSVGSAGFCLAHVPTALEAAHSASDEEMAVVERIDRSVGGTDALSRASPATPDDLRAVCAIDEATSDYAWRDGFSLVAGLSDVAAVRSEFLVRDSNRYSAAAEVPDAEYRRSSRPVRSMHFRRMPVATS